MTTERRTAMMSRVYKIGRNEKNDIVLNNSSIAEFHAEVFVDPQGNCFYTDLNKPSGSKLNGKLLSEPVLLNPNDHLELGQGQHFDWEHIFFNRKAKQEEKKVAEPEKKPIPKSKPKAKTEETSFLKKNLDLIIIFGGIILMLFILGAII